MHYYQHHLGDYAKDTGHLSVTEHGAYRMLLDHYYSTETGLPADLGKLCRIARAQNKAERDAVMRVSAEFFVMRDGALIQKRVERELEEYRRLKQRNTENGRCGGRPAKNPVGFQSDNSGFQVGSVSETQTKATRGRVHPPSTSIQDPVLLTKEPKLPAAQEEPFRGDSTVEYFSDRKPAKKRSAFRKARDPEADPRHYAISSRWKEVYSDAAGEEGSYDGGRDGKALQRFLAGWKGSADEFLDTAGKAIKAGRMNAYQKHCRVSTTVSGLCHHWTAVRAELSLETRGANGRPVEVPRMEKVAFKSIER